jgi:hypothetical protein
MVDSIPVIVAVMGEFLNVLVRSRTDLAKQTRAPFGERREFDKQSD